MTQTEEKNGEALPLVFFVSKVLPLRWEQSQSQSTAGFRMKPKTMQSLSVLLVAATWSP